MILCNTNDPFNSVKDNSYVHIWFIIKWTKNAVKEPNGSWFKNIIGWCQMKWAYKNTIVQVTIILFSFHPQDTLSTLKYIILMKQN